MDETQKVRGREITKALADLDVLFSTGMDQNQNQIWTMNFTADGADQPYPVVLQLQGDWIVIWHQIGGAVGDYPPTMLRELLELNGRLAIAKVALDADGRLGVSAQVAFGRLSPQALNEAFGAVISGARELRERLKIIPPSQETPSTRH